MALASQGKRVLLVDNDPQANLTTSFGVEGTEELPVTLHELLTMMMEDRDMPDHGQYILHGDKVDLIPSNINLSVTEINLRDELGGEGTLSALLAPLRQHYDYILIDTNPYLGLLTINALTACDSVIIPVSSELWSANGLTDLLKIILKVQRKLNPRIKVSGILITMAHERTVLYREAKDLIDEYFAVSIRIFDTVIPATTQVGRANFHSHSVMDYAPRNKAALAYVEFAKAVLHHGRYSDSDEAQTPA